MRLARLTPGYRGHQERAQLMRIGAEGGRPPEPAGSLVTDVGQTLSFNPDGSRVVYSEGTRAAELWVLDNLASLIATR